MARVIDFEQTVRQMLGAHGLYDDPKLAGAIADQLRRVWNERGTADIATVERELSAQMGAMAAAPYLTALERALRQNDR